MELRRFRETNRCQKAVKNKSIKNDSASEFNGKRLYFIALSIKIANVRLFDETSRFFIYISYIPGLQGTYIQGNDNRKQHHLLSFSLSTDVYAYTTSYFSLRE